MAVNFLKNLFFTAKDEIEAVPSLKSSLQMDSPSYQLAFADAEFLLRPELRPVRFQLELLKPEMLQQEAGVNDTLAVFGSARIHEKAVTEKALKKAEAAHAENPNDSQLARKVAIAKSMVAKGQYYEQARKLGQLLAKSNKSGQCPLVMVSGAGPGIMEAANRGVHDEGGKSVGLKIALPMEDEPNDYVTPELCFQFHYFALRKMHFLMRAKAIVAFPGGFGTFDELFETLTLMQTGKIHKVPCLLFGESYWKRIFNFPAMVEEGVIAPDDLNLFKYVETAEEAWAEICQFYEFDTPSHPS